MVCNFVCGEAGRFNRVVRVRWEGRKVRYPLRVAHHAEGFVTEHLGYILDMGVVEFGG